MSGLPNLHPAIPASELRWSQAGNVRVVAERVAFADFVMRELGLTVGALRSENEPPLRVVEAEKARG